MKRFSQLLTLSLAAVALVLALESCGKKEDVKSPEGSTYPRQYPKP
jgi:hypothetical protein